MSRPCVFITGASSGIGRACAHKFAKAGYNLILAARRVARLEHLREELMSSYDVKAQTFKLDVRDRAAVNTAINQISDSVDVLVNNAGLAAGFDPIQNGDINDWEAMIDTNIKGLLYVSRALVPRMVDKGRGHIINIGSTAGKDVYGKGGVYCATKHAVDALSRGMRIDLLGTGVKVTQIAPGAAETEFSNVRFKGDTEIADKVYQGYDALRGEDVAELCLYVTTLPAHVCVNDLVVTATAQADSHHIYRTT